MPKGKSRRKLSNLVVDAKALARLSIPVLILALVSMGTVFMVHWRVMQALQQTELHGIENLAAINTLLDVQSSVTKIAAYGVVVLALVCLGVWIVFSHRIFGPVVPMRRHIQRLSSGDYASRIVLRSGDEFKELIEDLNHLAEVLNAKETARL